MTRARIRAANPIFTWAIVALVATGIIALIVYGVRYHNQQTNRCHAQGGIVHTDRDVSYVYNHRTGHTDRHVDTQHECMVNGVEVFEW